MFGKIKYPIETKPYFLRFVVVVYSKHVSSLISIPDTSSGCGRAPTWSISYLLLVIVIMISRELSLLLFMDTNAPQDLQRYKS